MTATEIKRQLARLSDRDILARCIWGEARGESVTGMLAVAHVVLNRVKAGKSHYGSKGGVSGVILKPAQFSCFNSNDPNLKWMLHPPNGVLRTCEIVAELALSGYTIDPTSGSTHYANLDVCNPAWRRTMENKGKIGRHTFYKEG